MADQKIQDTVIKQEAKQSLYSSSGGVQPAELAPAAINQVYFNWEYPPAVLDRPYKLHEAVATFMKGYSPSQKPPTSDEDAEEWLQGPRAPTRKKFDLWAKGYEEWRATQPGSGDNATKKGIQWSPLKALEKEETPDSEEGVEGGYEVNLEEFPEWEEESGESEEVEIDYDSGSEYNPKGKSKGKGKGKGTG